MVKLFFITLLLTSLATLHGAKSDFKLGASGRSYPGIGSEATLSAGEGLLLRGDPKGFLYSYLRPYINAQSSGVINSFDQGIEFAPLALIQLHYIFTQGRSDFDQFDFANCDSDLNCRYQWKADRFLLKTGLKAGTLIFLYSKELSRFRYSNLKKTGRVLDFRFVLKASRDGEDLTRERFILGNSYSDKSMIGFLLENTHTSTFNQFSRFQALIYQYQSKKQTWKNTLGVGTLESSDRAQGLVFFYQFHYTFAKGLSLF